MRPSRPQATSSSSVLVSTTTVKWEPRKRYHSFWGKESEEGLGPWAYRGYRPLRWTPIPRACLSLGKGSTDTKWPLPSLVDRKTPSLFLQFGPSIHRKPDKDHDKAQSGASGTLANLCISLPSPDTEVCLLKPKILLLLQQNAGNSLKV